VARLTIVLATDVPENFGSTTQKLLSQGIAFMRIIFQENPNARVRRLQDG
jgi:hypothetical protein